MPQVGLWLLAILSLFLTKVATPTQALAPVRQFRAMTIKASIVSASPSTASLRRCAMVARMVTVSDENQVSQPIVVPDVVNMVDVVTGRNCSVRLLPYPSVFQHSKSTRATQQDVAFRRVGTPEHSRTLGWSLNQPNASFPGWIFRTLSMLIPMAVFASRWILQRFSVLSRTAKDWLAANCTGFMPELFHGVIIPQLGGRCAYRWQ